MNDDVCSMFNMPKLAKDIEYIVSGKSLGPKLKPWAKFVPGSWRFSFARKTNINHPLTTIMRLCQLNLYLYELKIVNRLFPEKFVSIKSYNWPVKFIKIKR